MQIRKDAGGQLVFAAKQTFAQIGMFHLHGIKST